jgi:hypothetical protein
MEQDTELIFLEMNLCKSLQKDEYGNVIFEVEASNENLDIEQQRVLQSALMKTKNHFLKNGHITKDHKHRKFNKDGSFEIDEDFVIGEPLEVFTRGTSTLVKGKLYSENKYAQKFINLLEQGSTRVKASVGGLVPRIKNTVENGKKIGEVISVLWDDLALTIAPVNPTVEHATSMAKSLSSIEFVKALSAGSGVNSEEYSGGRALQKEDIGHETVNEKVIASLVGAIADGDVADEDEAESFLIDYGISKSDACEIVREVCKKSNLFMEVFPMAEKAKTVWEMLEEKVLGKSNTKAKNDEEPDTTSETPTNEPDDDDFVEATDVVKALTEKVGELVDGMEVMAKSLTALLENQEKADVMQKSLGEGILAVLDQTEKVLASPTPRKGAVTSLETALAKSAGAATPRHRQFKESDLPETREILTKAVAAGKITTLESSMAETQINKSIRNAMFQVDPKFISLLSEKV